MLQINEINASIPGRMNAEELLEFLTELLREHFIVCGETDNGKQMRSQMDFKANEITNGF